MNAGQIIGFLWTLAFWFLLISFFVLPVIFAYWRHREHVAKAATDAALKRCKSDTSGGHIWDAS